MPEEQTIVSGNWNPFDFLISGNNAILLLLIILFFIFLLLNVFGSPSNVARNMRKGRLFCFIFIITFSLLIIPHSTPISGQDIINEPIVEVLDLLQDGSGSGGTFVNISYDFDYVLRIIWVLEFMTNTLDYDKFGDDTALSNGINVYYNDVSLLDNVNITNNHRFAYSSFDVTVLSDSKNPISHVLVSRWTFGNFVKDPEGLKVSSERLLSFHIQDNLTDLSSISEFYATVEGYSTTVSTYFYSNELFYPNVYNSIELRFLTSNQNYNLKLNSSSTSVLDWINTTAKTETIKVQFFIPTSAQDSVISLWLYSDNTFLERHDLVVMPYSTGILEVIISLLPYGVFFFLLTVVIFLLTGSGGYRGRK